MISMSPLIFVNIRIGFFPSFKPCSLAILVVYGFSLVFQGILSSLCSMDFFVFSCILAWGELRY